ncbi:AhpC/TSA family protein [Crocinitomicaceae bacterium]|nr:AhpC/TSA family protein [Crocinitomicaceae bacterium]
MIKSTIAFFLLLSLSLSAQTPINFKVSGNIFNTDEDTINISQFYGNHYVDLISIPLNEKGDFSFSGIINNPDYYALKVGDKHINLIIRKDSDIKVYGDGSNIQEFTNIVGSDETVKMNELVTTLAKWTNKQDSAKQLLEENPQREAEINQSMKTEFTTYQTNIQAFVSQNPNSAALLPVLSLINMENETETYGNILGQIATGFPESATVKEIQKQFLAVQAKKEKDNILAPGKVAPDFTETKIDGGTMSLSDLRGQVVLLDFWASWCGPCRRENPNVVKLYNKYKEDGFTVMSVSLDKEKAKWQAAIDKDNLSWPNHVSDLNGWSSAAPKKYNVRGIPFTVLIDKEGNIIKSNLRGEDLENELKSIFGH